MLYNPKWNDVWSLSSLIAWLETKDPDERYQYQSCCECLIAQYLIYRGWREPRVGPHDAEQDNHMPERLPPHWDDISNYGERTFGAALERVRICKARSS
jgi:hypothetical protein